MKRSPLRKRGKRSKSVPKLLWPEFRALILKRDKHCLYHADMGGACGGSLQGSHILPKGEYPLLELFPLNVKILCWRAHWWWHHNPIEATMWWEKHFGPEWMTRLHEAKYNCLHRKGWTAEQYRAEWKAYGL